MEVREVDVADLKAAPYNPRQISDTALNALEQSIVNFDLVEPIIWNETTGHVVGGNQRLKVLQRRGDVRTSVVVVRLDLEHEKALNVALNSRHLQGEWSADLGAILQELKTQLPELSAALNLDALEIDFQKMFPTIGTKEADEVPEAPEQPISVLGDLWLLGRHRVLCGDSTKPETYQQLFPNGDKAAIVVTDPPYGVAFDGNRHRSRIGPGQHGGGVVYEPIANDNLVGPEFLEFLASAFRGCAEVSRPDASWYVWYAAAWTLNIFLNALTLVGIQLHQEIIWAKESFQFGRADYQWSHEPCFYGWGKKHRFIGPRNQQTVWQVPRQSDHLHPTQKPVEVFARPMRNNALSNEICLDPFLGTGTAVIAAEQTTRTCYGIELAEIYIDLIVKRFEQFTGLQATLCRNGNTLTGGYENIGKQLARRERKATAKA